MADRDLIITLPNPHLRTKSKQIHFINDELKRVIADMKRATLDWEQSRPHEVGVALAAIQIDQPYRIVIIRNNPEDKEDKDFSVFINPKITKLEGVLEEDYEGCLSVKDIYGKVVRHTKVRISALNELGEPVRVRAEGFLARIFQHEVDHLNGLVFLDRIKNVHKGLYRLTKSGKLKKINEDDKTTADILR